MLLPSALQLSHFRSQLKRFADFTDEEWRLFVPHLYLRRLKKGELFARGDKTCNEVGFVYYGSFRFYYLRDGVEISNYFCFQNELISSYRSFLKRVPGGMFIDAMETAETICFNHASLQELLSDGRTAFKMEQFGRTVAEYLICCYDERVLSFITQSPEERYVSLLQEQPAFLQKVPQRLSRHHTGVAFAYPAALVWQRQKAKARFLISYLLLSFWSGIEG
jgi:hypothetical protein